MVGLCGDDSTHFDRVERSFHLIYDYWRGMWMMFFQKSHTGIVTGILESKNSVASNEATPRELGPDKQWWSEHGGLKR